MGLGRTTRFAPLPPGASRVSVMRRGAAGLRDLAPSAALLAAFESAKAALVGEGWGRDRAHVVSLNTPTSRGQEQQTEIGETIAAPIGQHDPERALLAGERLERFRAAMTTLSERERMVLGLVHVHHVQGAEVGRMLGVTESRVSQILSSARRKLREELASYEGTIERLAS